LHPPPRAGGCARLGGGAALADETAVTRGCVRRARDRRGHRRDGARPGRGDARVMDADRPPSQVPLLIRTFLVRFGDNDVMAPGTDLVRSAIWLMAFIMAPGFILAFWFTPNYQ